MPAVDEEDYEALLQFLYMAPIGLVQTRMDGEIVMINPVCAQLLMPLAHDGELTNLFAALENVAPDLRLRARDYPGSHGMVCDALHLQIDAGRRGLQDAQILSLNLMKLDDERLMAVIGDVTASVKRDRELRQSRTWITTLISGMTDYALLPLDRTGCIERWNPGVGRVTGFDSESAVGRSISMFYPEDDGARTCVLDRLQEADRSGWSLDEGWRLRADGTRFWGSCLIAPLNPAGEATTDQPGYSLILRDITDRREAHEALRRSIFSDHLTGVANRRAFFEAAELELRRWAHTPHPVSLVMIDADHFKRVNDSYGHAAGDAVLRHLATVLVATFRATDVVARIGGEEFVVLLPGSSLEGAAAVASRLCETIAVQAVDVDGNAIRYTVSAGVAVIDDGIKDLDALIKRADAALYAAKTRGRNRVECWSPELAATVSAPLPA